MDEIPNESEIILTPEEVESLHRWYSTVFPYEIYHSSTLHLVSPIHPITGRDVCCGDQFLSNLNAFIANPSGFFKKVSAVYTKLAALKHEFEDLKKENELLRNAWTSLYIEKAIHQRFSNQSSKLVHPKVFVDAQTQYSHIQISPLPSPIVNEENKNVVVTNLPGIISTPTPANFTIRIEVITPKPPEPHQYDFWSVQNMAEAQYVNHRFGSVSSTTTASIGTSTERGPNIFPRSRILQPGPPFPKIVSKKSTSLPPRSGGNSTLPIVVEQVPMGSIRQDYYLQERNKTKKHKHGHHTFWNFGRAVQKQNTVPNDIVGSGIRKKRSRKAWKRAQKPPAQTLYGVTDDEDDM